MVHHASLFFASLPSFTFPSINSHAFSFVHLVRDLFTPWALAFTSSMCVLFTDYFNFNRWLIL